MLKKMLNKFVKEENGQGMIEYAILAALLVVAVIFIVGALGKAVGGKFTTVTNELNGTGTNSAGGANP